MLDLTTTNPFVLALAAVVAIIGVGRLSRVITYDSWPPAAWWRAKWTGIVKDSDWSLLFTCQWCFTPWLMAACLAWAWFSGLHWTWWVFFGWLALSYLASMVIARDEPEPPTN